MAKQQQKLNSMRLLDSKKIPYEVFNYDASIKDATLVAESVGLPEWTVFKTLVVQSATGNKPFLVMIPSNHQLDLKKMAKAIGEKKVAMASHADAEKLTGLQVGGISALALTHKNWDVYLHNSVSELQHIVISGGQRGTQIRLATLSLIQLLHCKIVDVAEPMQEDEVEG